MKRSGPYQERRPPAERAEGPPGDVAPGTHSPARRREWVESPVSRVTHIADSARGQLAIPPVLELLDLAVRADVDPDDRVHDLLLLDALDDVLVAHVQLDGVSRGLDLVRLQLDWLEHRREAIKLCGVLGIAGCDSDVVGECGILIPKAEVLESRVTLEKLSMMLARSPLDGDTGTSGRLRTSRTEPTRTFCCSERFTPGAVSMFVLLMPMEEKEGALASADAWA